MIKGNFSKEQFFVSDGVDSEALKNDFLMSPIELDALRLPPKTPEKLKKIDQLNKVIDKVVGGGHLEIFQKLTESKKHNEESPNLLREDLDVVLKEYSPNTKLIDLPPYILGKILRPLSNEIRQMIYVQRNTISLLQAVKVCKHWTENVVIAYHVSSKKIKDGILRPGEKETAVYFSTDIKQLFNTNKANYIYAFRLHNPEKYRYGALECFGKLELKKGDGVEIEDSLAISDPNNPAYRNQVLQSIGAEFSNYYGADDRARVFMEQASLN